jgi:hypothetical protein
MIPLFGIPGRSAKNTRQLPTATDKNETTIASTTAKITKSIIAAQQRIQNPAGSGTGAAETFRSSVELFVSMRVLQSDTANCGTPVLCVSQR